MSDRSSTLLVTLSALLLAGACGTESLSFETLDDGPVAPAAGAATGAGNAGEGGGGNGYGGAVPGPIPTAGAAGSGAPLGGSSSVGGGAGRAGAGGAFGYGGGGASGGTAGAAGTGAGASGNYREGGYAGTQNVLDGEGQVVDGALGYAACGAGGWVSPFVYDAESCTAGSLCTPPCGSAAECPTLTGGPASECRATLLGQLCALPCSGPSDCPAGMACLEDPRFGASCLFTATPANAGCDGGCVTGDGCGGPVSCCEGLVCAPWGSCEAVECLDFAWACPNGDLACCGALVCRDGYCQSPA